MATYVQSAAGANHVDECKRRAADCAREADCASDDMLRQAYLQMARVWRKMAEKEAS
jgi:hypothetical protein